MLLTVGRRVETESNLYDVKYTQTSLATPLSDFLTGAVKVLTQKIKLLKMINNDKSKDFTQRGMTFSSLLSVAGKL